MVDGRANELSLPPRVRKGPCAPPTSPDSIFGRRATTFFSRLQLRLPGVGSRHRAMGGRRWPDGVVVAWTPVRESRHCSRDCCARVLSRADWFLCNADKPHTLTGVAGSQDRPSALLNVTGRRGVGGAARVPTVAWWSPGGTEPVLIRGLHCRGHRHQWMRATFTTVFS